ncbi:MAG: HDOD domain-containing protein [Planctomycetota bacterium]
MESATSELSRVFGALLRRGNVELPSMPGTAAQVMDLSQQESTDARKLSEVIHSDQAIASNVMRVANSAAYSGEVPITSLQQAVSRLGLQLITEISMAVSLRGRLFRNEACVELLSLQWRHSVLAGFFTKEIARMRRRNVEIAFLCGLLHDVGKAVLLNNVDRVLEDQSLEVPMADLWEAVHDQHAAAGKLLTSRWQLPEQIADAIIYHHAPAKSESFADMAMMVCLADHLSHFVSPNPYGTPVNEAQLRGLDEVVGLNLYTDQLDELLAMKDRALEVMEGMQ